MKESRQNYRKIRVQDDNITVKYKLKISINMPKFTVNYVTWKAKKAFSLS